MRPSPFTLDRSSNLGDLTAPGKTRPCNKINNLPKQDNSVQIIPLWSQMSKEWRQAYNNATRAAKIKRKEKRKGKRGGVNYLAAQEAAAWTENELKASKYSPINSNFKRKP